MNQATLDAYYKEIDKFKGKMPDGPWMVEPHRMEWKHAGLDCLIVRNPSSFALCGYVGITPDHPDYGKHYDEVEVDVHGGLTYSKECSQFICHIAPKGEDNLWWLGFDCAHVGDVSPSILVYFPESEAIRAAFFKDREIYRDIEYVKREVNRLADQLIERKTAKNAFLHSSRR